MGIKKFNGRVVKDIVESCYEGYSDAKIAIYIGVSANTLNVWKKKYPHLKEAMIKARGDSAKELIETGLRKLSRGAKDITTTEEFVTSRRIKKLEVCEESGETIEVERVIPVKRTRTTKEKAPDSKAIEILSRKYYKEFDPKSEEREVNTKVLEGFTMRNLQEARKSNPIDAGKIIDAEFTEK
jgi:hypothetical protein